MSSEMQNGGMAKISG